MAILPDLAQMQAQLAALMAENERLKASANKSQRITIKVSEKGLVSVYGLGRFPVSLYATQWERLLPESDRIAQFIKDNHAALARKE